MAIESTSQTNNSSSTSSASIHNQFCNECVWKRWQPTAHYQNCIGRVNELVSKIYQNNEANGRSFEELKSEVERQILNESCIDPNVDIHESDYDDGNGGDSERNNSLAEIDEFCGGCFWRGSEDSCNTKVDNMMKAYSISRERAIGAVLMDCKGSTSLEERDAVQFHSLSSGYNFNIGMYALALAIAILIFIARRKRQSTSSSTKQKLGKGILCLIIITCTIFIFRTRLETISSTSSATHKTSSDNVHITLCNRKSHLNNMPPLPPNLTYGFATWNHHSNFGINPRTNLGGGVVAYNNFLYGRTGNNIREFFHAFDKARNEDSPLVFHERGFPMDKPLNELFLGLERSQLEQLLGFKFYGNVKEEHKSKLRQIKAGKLFYYNSIGMYESQNITKEWKEQIDHRHYVLQESYRLTAKEMELHPDSFAVKEMCQSLHAIFGSDGLGNVPLEQLKQLGINRTITQQYTVVHSRYFEGAGDKMMIKSGNRLGIEPSAYIDVPSDMIVGILSALSMMKNKSILMITDGWNTGAVEQLSNDPIVGPHFQVIPPSISTMISDVMLAILSTSLLAIRIRH